MGRRWVRGDYAVIRLYRAPFSTNGNPTRAGLTRASQAAGGRFLRSSSADDLEAMMLAGLRAGAVRRG